MVFMKMENAINTLDSKITEYLVLISHETLNDHDSNDYLANMKTIKDFERIGDLCINIAKYYEAIYDEKEDFSFTVSSCEDLEAMMDMVIDMLQITQLKPLIHMIWMILFMLTTKKQI